MIMLQASTFSYLWQPWWAFLAIKFKFGKILCGLIHDKVKSYRYVVFATFNIISKTCTTSPHFFFVEFLAIIFKQVLWERLFESYSQNSCGNVIL